MSDSSTDVGSLRHWLANRSEYLTRRAAAERLTVTRRTIERYLKEGLTSYDLPGGPYVHIDELQKLYRKRKKANPAQRKVTIWD